MSGSANLSSFPILGTRPVQWRLRSGVQPTIETFDLPAESVDALLGLTIVSLTIQADGLRPVTFSGLYIIGEVSTENPYWRRVQVADQRFFWSYRHVRRHYNWRRVVGYKRLRDPQTLEIQPLADEIAFAPFSLYPPHSPLRKWTSAEVVEDVFKAVIPDGRKVPGAAGFDQIPVEDLELDDPGDAAIMRSMGFLTGANVTLDADGEARLYFKHSGGEQFLGGLENEEVAGRGHLRHIDRSRVRPKKIHVLFTREHELRFDFIELASKTATVAEEAHERYADNVLPVPDFWLEVAGTKVPQGTWARFDEVFVAWGNLPDVDGIENNSVIDHELVQICMVPYVDLWSSMRLNGLRAEDGDLADWGSRIAAIQAHYRTTFRLRRAWMERILRLRASRVAILDTAIGARGPAVAYSDFCWLASMRSLHLDRHGNRDLAFATNVARYPHSHAEHHITSRDAPSPAKVSILDEDQGIIHLAYVADPWGKYSTILPGCLETAGSEMRDDGAPKEPGPIADFAAARDGIPVAFNAVGKNFRSGRYPKLSSSHKVAVILTAIPGGPNTNEQLFSVEVKPEDVSDLFKKVMGADSAIGGCTGPELTIRIPAGVETARVAWLDSRADDIDKSFGRIQGEANIDDLVLNLESGSVKSGDVGGATLDALARAAAARVWISMADRIEGQATYNLQPAWRIEGWIEEIKHSISPRGETMTEISLPQGEVAQLKLWSVMGTAERRTLMKLARPGKD